MSDPLASAEPTAGHGCITSHLGTEFGRVLAELVGNVPGALGAVLSDREGHAVDFAIDAAHYDALELQIAGAQLGHALTRTHESTVRHRIGTASVLVEAERGALLCAVVEPRECAVLVLVLGPHASLGRALVRFDHATQAIATLLA